MFRRHGVVTVEFVEFWWILEITFDYVPRVAVGGNIHQIKVGNFVLRKEAEISFRQGLRHGRSIEVICVQICNPTVGFGRVVPLHQRVIGLGISVRDGRDPAPHIFFSIIKYMSGSVMRSNLAVVYFKADANASDARVIKWRGSR